MEIAQSHIASFTCTLILSTPVTETETPFVFSLQSLARSQRMSRTMQALYSIDPRIAKDVFETEGKLDCDQFINEPTLGSLEGKKLLVKDLMLNVDK